MDLLSQDPFENVSMLLAVLLSVFVIIMTIGIWYATTRASSKRKILLLGASGAGKTKMFTFLTSSGIGNSKLETVTSISENSGFILVNGKFVPLVDVPGFGRVRGMILSQYIHQAKAIVWVIDSGDMNPGSSQLLKDVAEYLSEVLVHVYRKKIPVLIACNKADKLTSKGKEVVHSSLANELSAVKMTRSVGSDNGIGLIPDMDELIEKKLVSFQECSCVTEDGCLDVLKWISKHV